MKQMKDFLVPEKNEEELILNAIKKGIKEIILLYDINEYKKNRKQLTEKISELNKVYNQNPDNKIKINFGIIHYNSSPEKIKRDSSLSSINVVKADNKLREVIEKNKNLYVYNLEMLNEKDSIQNKNSGLNHILLEIAKQNKIGFLFNFSDFIKLNNFKKAIVIGKLSQNIRLCNKYGVELKICSFASSPELIKYDFNSFLNTLKSKKI